MNKEKIYSKIPYGLYGIATYLLVALVFGVVKSTPILFGVGTWLLKSFGIIAFYIPIYFALCGLMAARKEIPLKSLLRLNLSFLPFFTIALMIHVIQNNVDLLIVAKITESFGRVIASLVLFFLAGLEVLTLTKLSDILFPEETLTLSHQLREGKLQFKKHSLEQNKSENNTNVYEAFATPDFPEPLVSPLCMPNLGMSNMDMPNIVTWEEKTAIQDMVKNATIEKNAFDTKADLPQSEDLIKSILNNDDIETKDFPLTSNASLIEKSVQHYNEENTPDSFYADFRQESKTDEENSEREESEDTVEFFLEDPAISFLSESNPTKSQSQSVINDIDNIRTDEKLNFLISSLDSVLDPDYTTPENTHFEKKTSYSNPSNCSASAPNIAIEPFPEEDRDNIGIDNKFEEAKFFEPQTDIPAFKPIDYNDSSYNDDTSNEEASIDSDFNDSGHNDSYQDYSYQNEKNEVSCNNESSYEEVDQNEFNKISVAAVQNPPTKEVKVLSPQSSRKRNGAYSIPIEGVLDNYPGFDCDQVDEMAEKSAHILEKTLKEFNIEAKVTGIKQGPVITMFEILPSPGVKLSKIVGLQDNIALRLAASRIRIVAPIPGKHAVGIEIPNKKRELVSFQSILERRSNKTKDMALPFFLGTDIGGGAQIMDLAKTPHLLIAGATGSGKSVCVNSLICSLLYEKHPNDVKMILVDPKIVELKLYNDIPHLLTPVITETKKALQALQWALYEMEKRYSLLDGMGVREIVSYNKKIKERDIAAEKLPYILIVIDEFADLMATAGKELEGIVARLAAMARAVGIHLVLATQRPSTNVITGLIKANFPSRIAFMVAQMVDSRIIIDTKGAEKLLGKGDMLFTSSWDPFPTRLQGAFLSEDEVERVCNSAREWGKPNYIDDEMFYEDEDDDDRTHLYGESSDPLFTKATEIIFSSGKASASYLQRRLSIGYNRAARIIEEMEDQGMVGPPNGSKAREVIGTHSSYSQSAGV